MLSSLVRNLCTLLLVLSLPLTVHAKVVSQKIESLKLDVEAAYLQGDQDKPAVLILHGFLTTDKFHTISAMASALNDEGFTVLSPTLSLDVNKRKNSVKCNSLHTHTLEKDIIEIGDWINWLEEKGHKQVILVGHSSGSLELLEYQNKYKDPRVKSMAFTSIFYLKGQELGTIQQEIDLAEKMISSAKKRPHKYSFLFCKNNYYATPESYLSYLKFDRNYVLESVRNLKISSYAIMGGADKRYKSVGESWLSELEKTGINLVVIEGANHFFSSEHEFDLQDQLVAIINKIKN